jgi:hypothetical protein
MCSGATAASYGPEGEQLDWVCECGVGVAGAVLWPQYRLAIKCAGTVCTALNSPPAQI